jgi:UTP--glucose-1-phosphate uridylyltransferase
MKLKKAVITAAAPAQRLLPLQRLVDRDGCEKTALRIVIEEVASAGVDEIAAVICPGDAEAYRAAAGDVAARLVFIEQDHPRGYGDALHRAAGFTGREPFVHLVGDHLYVSASDQRCAQQLVEIAQAQACSVSAVQPTRENMLPYYGVVGGRRVQGHKHLYEIERVVEKPTPTEAEQTLIVPGLRAGHYLCLFGMHALTPAIMDILGEAVAATPAGRPIQLSPALDRLAQRERHLALEVAGKRYNIGVKYGILTAQLALALAGGDRAEVLAEMVELLAT